MMKEGNDDDDGQGEERGQERGKVDRKEDLDEMIICRMR